jgi:hypothetical protein
MEKNMLDSQIDDALSHVGDLGLTEPHPEQVEQRCLAALRREFHRELRPERRRRVAYRLRRLRRSAVVVPIALLLGGTAGAVGYAALNTASTASAGIECHVGSTLAGSATITHLDGGRAIDVCARLWAQGAVDPHARAPSAPLYACVSPDATGPVHVLEGHDDSVCARADLRADPDAGADPQASRYGQFAQRLTEDLQRPEFRCATPAELRLLVDQGLQRAGLTGWTTAEDGRYDAQRPCASLAIDSDARVVTISPAPR